MKTILGLDIGVSSIGLAIVKEKDNKKTIENLVVRIVPEDSNFHGKFYSGKRASKNHERTIKRGIRRSNQRFKARRDKLYRILKANEMFPSNELFKLPTKELYKLRANAAKEKIALQELGRVLILLNQRRGFLSNRKSISKEEEEKKKPTEYKKELARLEKQLEGKTIGQQLFLELQKSNNSFDVLLRERTYQRSTYIKEFDRIWEEQKKHHSILTGGINEDDNEGTLYDEIRNKTIYYQRPLKSQKGSVAECPFEKHHKAVTKSSPYFELFRILQKVNDLSWKTADGKDYQPTAEQKKKIKGALWVGEGLNAKHKLTVTKIKELLGFSRNDKVYLNFTELDGSRTYSVLKNALEEAKIENPENYLFFNLNNHDEKGGLFELWHITYSLPTEKEVVNALMKRFKFTKKQSETIAKKVVGYAADYGNLSTRAIRKLLPHLEKGLQYSEACDEVYYDHSGYKTAKQSETIAKKVGYAADYGNLSTRAIRKLLPHLEKGLQYSEACDEVNYDHSGYKTAIELQPKLKPLKKNELRNPVVEQILNQVVNVINLVIEEYGTIDEIRVELARELRNSAETRKNISKANSKNKKNNDKIRKELKEEHGLKLVTGRDVKRYILWKETDYNCLYCNNKISGTDVFSTGNANIEHILPKSRSFNDAMTNYIIAHRKCNTTKGQSTAYDFMASKGKGELEQYTSKVDALYKNGKGTISKAKLDNLLCKGEDIPSDFVERMKKDTQYIAKESVKLLKTICKNVYTTTGQVTDFLRSEWELKEVLQELGLDKYKAIGQTEEKTIKTKGEQTKTFEVIKDWSKRDDHRHHAVDALICALTDQKIIFKLNNLNKIYQYEKNTLTKKEIEDSEKSKEGKFSLKEFANQKGNSIKCAIPNIRSEAKKHLENIFISFKKENSKVLTKNSNHPKHAKEPQTTWVPRARLHEETIMGRVKLIAEKKMKLNTKVSLAQIELVISPNIKALLYNHLLKFDTNPKLAFDTKNLKKAPILYKGKELKEVAVYEWVNTKRVDVNGITSAQVKKIIDKASQRAVKERLAGGKVEEAFKNLEKNPIRLKNGMILKTVTVSDNTKVAKIRNGYAILKNNHHALIYKDEKGKYNEKVISFWDAVRIGLDNIKKKKDKKEKENPYPIINRNDDPSLGKFQFAMQENDLFVFDLKHSKNPQEENELNFFDTKNRKRISAKLFRFQDMSKRSDGCFVINFRHHLETTKNRNDKNLKSITWERISKNADLERLTKIKLNHLGVIIKIGE